MKLYDKHHRVLCELSRHGLQLWSFTVERSRGDINGWIIGFDREWLNGQTKKASCAKCGRWVPSPCNDADGYYGSGPWDTWCHDVFHPLPGYLQ